MKTSGFFELVLLLVAGWFVYISYGWIKLNGISDSNSMIALATIVYAVFTFFMFWSMKTSSEAQIRPFLHTKLQDDLDLKIINQLSKNVAKNVKLRVKAIRIKGDVRKSKILFFIHTYLWRPVWNFLWDYPQSYREDFEIMEDNKSPSLIQYLDKTFSVKKTTNFHGDSLIDFRGKKGRINLKILVHITYESLMDVKYEIYETYYVFISNSNVEIIKTSS